MYNSQAANLRKVDVDGVKGAFVDAVDGGATAMIRF